MKKWHNILTFEKSDHSITPCEVTARQHQELQAKFRDRKENIYPDKINSHTDPCEQTQNKTGPSYLGSDSRNKNQNSKPIR